MIADTSRDRRERWLVATTEYAGVTSYTGGIGRHYAALLPALVRQGVDVDLLVFADGAPETRTAPGGVRLTVHRIDGMSPMRTLVFRARSLRSAYRAGSYDRVFLPEWSALGSGMPASAPLLTNMATSTRLANEASGLRLRDLPRSRRIPVLLQSAAESRQIRRSKGLIPISTAMLTWTQGAFANIPPARVVANCIDVAEVSAQSKTAAVPARWPVGGEPIVLFLGRAERRKGVVDAVRAFALLHAHAPDVRFVVAGAGGDARYEPTRQDLLALLPETARHRVTWLGHVPGAELYAAVRAADVVLCPSRWEGFGNVALEVKSIGTPLIVTSGSGFDDFCADGVDCAMVPPADPAALAEATRGVLERPDRSRALAAAAAADVGAFAPDPIARALLDAADELLGPSDRRSRSQ